MKALILLFISSAALAASQCGIHLPKPNSSAARYARSIIGGRDVTTPSKWPWHLILDGISAGMCGGTLVSSQWVLTAGHCIGNYNESGGVVYKSMIQHPKVLLVLSDPTTKMLGTAEMRNHSEFREKFSEHTFTVAEIHPDFKGDPALINDIALLKLETPVTFDHNVAPICLPSAAQSIPNDGQAVATGIGYIEGPGTNNVTVGYAKLREAIVPIIPKEVCDERWSDFDGFLDDNGIKTTALLDTWSEKKIICAGSRAHGGDSGGPLMMKASDGRWFQIGITSFINPTYKNGIDAERYPKAFTDIRPYCTWIEETTGGEVSCQEEEVTLEDVEIKI